MVLHIQTYLVSWVGLWTTPKPPERGCMVFAGTMILVIPFANPRLGKKSVSDESMVVAFATQRFEVWVRQCTTCHGYRDRSLQED